MLMFYNVDGGMTSKYFKHMIQKIIQKVDKKIVIDYIKIMNCEAVTSAVVKFKSDLETKLV